MRLGLRDFCLGEELLCRAAQGVGVLYKGKHVGTFGDLGILSFYGNKTKGGRGQMEATASAQYSMAHRWE